MIIVVKIALPQNAIYAYKDGLYIKVVVSHVNRDVRPVLLTLNAFLAIADTIYCKIIVLNVREVVVYAKTLHLTSNI